MEKLIAAEHLSFHYTDEEGKPASPEILKDLTLTLEAGSFVAVLGHNGCGGRCTGGDGGGHSGTAAAVRGISAAGGRRQPAAAMAGTKAKIAANSGNKMYTICLLSVTIRRFAV